MSTAPFVVSAADDDLVARFVHALSVVSAADDDLVARCVHALWAEASQGLFGCGVIRR